MSINLVTSNLELNPPGEMYVNAYELLNWETGKGGIRDDNNMRCRLGTL